MMDFHILCQESVFLFLPILLGHLLGHLLGQLEPIKTFHILFRFPLFSFIPYAFKLYLSIQRFANLIVLSAAIQK